MPRKEALNEEYLVERVEATGGVARKVVFVGRRGAPDRLAMWPEKGVSAWFEVKEAEQAGYGLQPHQEREHKRMRHSGMEVFVVSTKEAIDRVIHLVTNQ
jgi:hypothetical protein